MTVAMRRIASLVSAVALVVSGTAGAQVTIHVTTAGNTTCNITTDANGLRLASGGTDLIATGATLTGAGCGLGGGGPTPNPFALTVQPTATTGSPFAVSWNVAGANSCSGSATFNGTSLPSLAGWTDTTSPSSPRSVTAPAPGTYVLSLTCSNASGSANSLPATVLVANSGGGDSCPSVPRTRATVSDINYLPGTHIRHSVDLTQWTNIWGHITESDNVIPFPGPNGASPSIQALGKTQYIAAKFNTGSLPANLSGFYTNVSYGAGPNLDMSVSTECGDFAPAESGCIVTDRPSTDRILVYWRMINGTSFYCPLQPNTDYYLNIQFHDPATTGPGCSGATCKTTIQHNHQ
ncbi:MAG: hypothetical protein ABW186_04395 [Rhodanobacteraceae bacterium]